MKRGRKKHHGRRRSVSSDREEILIKHRRKRPTTDTCSNTLPITRSSGRREVLNELNGNVDASGTLKKASSMQELVSIDLTELDSPPMSPSARCDSPITILCASPDRPSSPVELLSPSSPSSPAPPSSPVQSKSVWKRTGSSNIARCKFCNKTKEEVIKTSLRLFGASEEEDIFNFREVRESWNIDTDIPLLKLTEFRVFDKARHLCPFDGPLLKIVDSLYFSGYVKPFTSEISDTRDGFACEDMGPITDWWFEGFDLNEESSIGFTTEMGHYYLMKPMREYAPFMTSVKEKIFVAKTVIDIVEKTTGEEDLTFDGLVESLKTRTPLNGMAPLTEEILLKYGAFVCEQAVAYDIDATEDEKLMVTIPCIQDLAKKVKFDFTAKHNDDFYLEFDSEDDSLDGDKRDLADLDEVLSGDDMAVKRIKRRRKDPMRRVMGTTKTIKLSKAATTPLVETIFTSFFSGQIMKNYTKDYSGDAAPACTTNSEFNSTRSYEDFNLKIPHLCLTKLENTGVDVKSYKIFAPANWNKDSKMALAMEEDDSESMEELKIDEMDSEPQSQDEKVKPPEFKDDDQMQERDKSKSDKEHQKEEKMLVTKPEEEMEVETETQVEGKEKIKSKEEHREEEMELELEAQESESKHVDRKGVEESEKVEEKETERPEPEQDNEKNELRVTLPVVRELECVEVERLTPDSIKFYLNKNKRRKPVKKTEIINLDSDECGSDSDYSPKRKKQHHRTKGTADDSDSESDSEYATKRRKKHPKTKGTAGSDREGDSESGSKGAKKKDATNDTADSDSENDSDGARQTRKDIANEAPSYSLLEFRQMLKRKKTRRTAPVKIMWVDVPYKEVDGYEYYRSVQINDATVSVGDYVSTYSSNSVGRVKYMFENLDEEQLFHVHWFTRSMDTILAEVGHPNELFESNKCEDVLLQDFYQVVTVEFVPTGSDWFDNGNMHYVNKLNRNEDPSRVLYYQKRYCEKTARFEDAQPESTCSLIDCFNCERQRRVVQREIPYTEDKTTYDKEMDLYALKTLRWRDEDYHVGTCVFLTPGTIMKLKARKDKNDEESDEDYDEDLYPEKYRKPSRVKSVQDEDVLSDPFEIGYISGMWSKRKEITKSSDVKLELKKFYRPHNTCLSQDVIRKLDLNLLYWSDEDGTTDFSKVQGKCYVSFEDNLKCSVDEWTRKGPHRFYFSQSYVKKFKIFEAPSEFAMKIGNLEKDDEKEHVDILPEFPTISRPLRSLDVFAGCGGLTEGLHQANVTECRWAIEKDVAAAKAFKANYPDATVFTDDCNLLLNAVVNRKETEWRGKKLPQRGEVELICGGPPCQGFSGMNRFRFGQWSQFNNSLVVSFLSYCDYYRPRFFVMENVRNFVSHEKCIVLKLTLNCLIKMGYQVAFGVLQSGRFGIPQSRRRVIILAAAPGEKLPSHPEATHTFALSGNFETVNVDETKYTTTARWNSSAPYRMITVYDALSDLPPIRAGDSQVEKSYGRKPLTHFQRELRIHNGVEEEVLRDHISKSLSALVVKRLSFIPKKLGCDWRDLPNIVVKLSDGNLTKKLRYTHHDVKQGKSSTGAFRGVCSCASNGKCKPEYRQGDTLIPWCLPHTSNRHGHWRGLYGRLGWDEYFRTVVTNPEPMGKQGRVVHPEEDRVISVKECARSQGFPDRFKFYGYILDKHRQIGNAVAPPLAKAIGLEIKKCIQETESKVEDIAD